MRGQATVEKARGFLRFEFDEAATIEDWREAQALCMQVSLQTGIRRVLVDLRRQRLSGRDLDLFNFGVGVPDGMVFAVLADQKRGDYRFVETVALNRGKIVRLFPPDEAEAAIQWLETSQVPGTRGEEASRRP